MSTRYMTLAQFKRATNTESALDAGEIAEIYESIEEMSRILDENARHPLYERVETRLFKPVSVDKDGAINGRKLVLDDFLLSPSSVILAGETSGLQTTDYQTLPLNGNYVSVIELVSDISSWVSSLYTLGSNIAISGIWGYPKNSWDAVSVLTAGIDEDDAVLPLTTVPSTLEKYQTLKVGSEYMEVVSINTLNVTVVRGVNGSTAVAHLIGAMAYVFVPAPVIRRAMKRFTAWWQEQDKAPLIGVVQVGDAAIPVNNSKIPPDLQGLMQSLRTASIFTKA